MSDMTIKMLTKAERVRLRPCVIFGTEGALAAAKLIIDICATESSLGKLKSISIRVNEENIVCISGTGRGLVLSDDLVDGVPAWQDTFLNLPLAPRREDEKYYEFLARIHDEMFGGDGKNLKKLLIKSEHRFDLSCVQYASETMHVESVVNGTKTTLDFSRGEHIGGPIRVPTSVNVASTTISFSMRSLTPI